MEYLPVYYIILVFAVTFFFVKYRHQSVIRTYFLLLFTGVLFGVLLILSNKEYQKGLRVKR